MSDPRQRDIEKLKRGLERLRQLDIPGQLLAYTPRVANPFPLASSGTEAGYFPFSQTWSVLAVSYAVFVVTTNNGSNYWTIAMNGLNSATAIATVTTSAISANTWTRITAASITQPSTSDVGAQPLLTATGSPGAIYLVPEIMVA